jgi:hypothetical protein
LVKVDHNNMFKLKNLNPARLWMLSAAAVEVAIELLWEDKLAHPQWPHVFAVPCFMTHIWRRDWGRVRIYFSLYQQASRFGDRHSLNH